MWDERYKSNPNFYGMMPNDYLVSAVHHLPKGKVLCLAEGQGRNSVFLARSGYQVTGVDASEQAMIQATQLATQNGVEIDYEVANLEQYPLGEQLWDGVVSIFCHLPKNVRQDLYKRVIKALKPGGVFIIESYTPAQLALGTGGPKDPDMLVTLQDLKQELVGLEFLEASETQRMIAEGMGHNGMSSVVQVIAKKVS